MKRYAKTVFAGKEVPFIGIGDGHGKLYRGNTVQFSLNMNYFTSMERRSGSNRESDFVGSVCAGFSGSSKLICEGQNIWSE